MIDDIGSVEGGFAPGRHIPSPALARPRRHIPRCATATSQNVASSMKSAALALREDDEDSDVRSVAPAGVITLSGLLNVIDGIGSKEGKHAFAKSKTHHDRPGPALDDATSTTKSTALASREDGEDSDAGSSVEGRLFSATTKKHYIAQPGPALDAFLYRTTAASRNAASLRRLPGPRAPAPGTDRPPRATEKARSYLTTNLDARKPAGFCSPTDAVSGRAESLLPSPPTTPSPAASFVPAHFDPRTSAGESPAS
ncbi:hypothetical protein B0H15DRAFT_951033 [Mycena belliarum]|uniref:Uncharacterized protein n=1 Tax=Mycena belliarum TaxID=1033014 RepID=A0AAD6U5E2_9AGAR|nr:hypothetical protein B0H15DRAFT_951033 [Mycena belliae]